MSRAEIQYVLEEVDRRLFRLQYGTGLVINQDNSHGSADTDTADSAIHHTLGSGQYQAASGMHTHSYFAWETFTFTQSVLSEGSNPFRYYVPGDFTIDRAFLSVGTPPSGSDLLVDVNKNGSTIFSTQGNRPTVLDGTYTGESGVPDETALVKNDYLTFDIDQAAGADLTVHVRCKQFLER